MREEIEKEKKEAKASGEPKRWLVGNLEASVRAAKKMARPTKLGVAPVKIQNKGKGKKGGNGGGGGGSAGGKKTKSSFSRDLGDKKRR